MKIFIIFLFFIGFNIKHFVAQNRDIIKTSPVIEWKFKTSAPIFSSPLIREEIVYVGSLDSMFYALDLKTGMKIWDFKTYGEIRSNAIIQKNNIYFVSGDGNLYCLNVNGKLTWTFKTNGEKKFDFADYHQSSPVIYNNSIYFGSGDGYVYSLNSINGELNWKYKTDNVVHSTPVVDGNNLYIGSFDGYVYAINLNDGSLKWKFKSTGHKYFPKGEVQGSPVIYNNIIFVGARDYKIYAIDKEKGISIWDKSFNKGWVLSNTIYNDDLFIAGADERILACLDPAKGNEKWKRNMEFLMFGRPAFNDSTLYIGTTIGKLHCINIKTGEEIWTFSTDAYKQNKFKYFKEDDTYRDDIYSIIKSNEHFLEVEIELGGFFSTPAIDKEFLVVTSTDGSIYCFKLDMD